MPLRRCFALVLPVALLLSMPVSAAPNQLTIQERIEIERNKIERQQQVLQAKRSQLHSAAARVNDLQAQLDQTNAAISQVDGILSHLGAEQREMERRLRWYNRQLEAAEKSLKLHDTLLRRRLVDIYEYGEPNYWSVLLAARSFSDFVESWDDLRLLIAANERAVRERRLAAHKVLLIQLSVEASELEMEREEQQQNEARSQLGALAAERGNLVSLADRDRRRIASQVTLMEGLSASEEAYLEALIAQRQRELAAEGRRAAGIAGIEPSNGRFSWPVSGTITSPFGWRSNPFGGGPEFHQGLDIAAPIGTTVTAAAAGTVIMAQWYDGYGNYILIDHGNHYSTGYGHLSAIYVSVGQVVQRGQAIGAVGSTGVSTGPHLHFEVRIDGKPVDPAPRLSH